MVYKYIATCALGIEGLLSDELKRLNLKNVSAENGRVTFVGDAFSGAVANIFSSLAERILISVGEFKATDFDTLFASVKSLPFENFIGKFDAFPVIGYSLNSALHSVPDCQSIIKKAIVERLKKVYKTDWFLENNITYKIRFSIIKDNVTIAIDTSGDALHKRGYRAHSNIAPIKETLAAAMCKLARIYPDTILFDPFCGSGTILIEAAMQAKNIAPGLKRNFAAEAFSFIGKKEFEKARTKALDEIIKNPEFKAFGFDIDDECINLTLSNAKKAGVENLISAKNADIADLSLPSGRLKLITNPPYGERLLDIKKAEEIYKIMGKVLPQEKGKGYFVISPQDNFEELFNRQADKKRKLYNGMLKCNLYMFFK